MVHDEHIMDDIGEDEMENDIVAEVEIGPQVAHVVESEDEVELDQLHHLNNHHVN